jgi:hypothetical protein
MAEEIINKVAQSKLVSIDLETFYPTGARHLFDLADWLYEGLILREKDFRERAKNYDWAQHTGAHVAVFCSADAIVPLWAFMLVSSQLQPYAKTVVEGDADKLESVLFRQWCDTHDFSQYEGKPMIIKGCSNKPVPTDAFVEFVNRAQPYAKSIMFGEPCSTVPVYKKK